MIKYMAVFIQIVMLSAVGYICYNNFNNATDVILINNSNPIAVNTALIIAILYFLGFLTGVVHSFVSKDVLKSQINFYARKNEKLSQQNEIDTDEKENLERKIATLEIALQNALKNKM